VKTDPNAEPRHKGMSLFIAPKLPGLTVGKKLDKLGYKAIDSAELIFANYRVPADHLIGGSRRPRLLPGHRGWSSADHVAARGVELRKARSRSRRNMRRHARRSASRFASTRRSRSSSLRWQPVHEPRACLRIDAAAAFDRGERCDMEGDGEIFASEAALENSIESMRIHGAYGYSKEYDIERFYRDAPLTVIGEGTNEIQRVIIAKQWLKRNL
jgi:alkylation response protein AidB-like acyl-CoA dehydrogenase